MAYGVLEFRLRILSGTADGGRTRLFYFFPSSGLNWLALGRKLTGQR